MKESMVDLLFLIISGKKGELSKIVLWLLITKSQVIVWVKVGHKRSKVLTTNVHPRSIASKI